MIQKIDIVVVFNHTVTALTFILLRNDNGFHHF